jgi:hypothetical protein
VPVLLATDTVNSDEYPVAPPPVGTTIALNLEIFCAAAFQVQLLVPTGIDRDMQPGILFPSAKKVTLPIESDVAVKVNVWPLLATRELPAVESETVTGAFV